VTRRYEIQEIVAQDADGVVFRAVDRESGRDAVLRRFFPKGRDGGGLDPAEQAAYQRLVEKMKALEHKGLRRVLDGGCDPVDGMPFLVTEWIEGTTLAEFSAGQTLSSDSVKGIVGVALECSREISKVLGEKSLWVGCGPEALVVPESGRGITFWIVPFRPKASQGLLPLVELAERLLNRSGPYSAEDGADGMIAWIHHIRTKPRGLSLSDALEALHQPPAIPVTATPTAQVKRAPGAATVPARALKKAKSKKRSWPWAVAAAALVLGGSFAFWKSGGIERIQKHLQGPQAARPATREEMIRDINARNAAPVATPASWNPNAPALPATVPTQPAGSPPAKAEPAAVTAANAANSLAGTVISAEKSNSGATRYLKLDVGGQPRWAGYEVSQNQPNLEMSDLESMKGKKVRVTGEKFKKEQGRGEVLFFKTRAQIEVQP
jgi:hypothetical protein